MSIAVPLGSNTADFNGMIKLNDTGVFIWERLSEDVTLDELVKAVASEYDVDEAVARADCEAFVASLRKGGFIEGITISEHLATDGIYVGPSIGISMYPMLKSGKTTVVIKSIDGVTPQKHDVLLYKVGDRYILHRLLAEKGDNYIIRGDNCYRKEIVPKSAIIGYLSEYHRGNKKIACSGFGWRSYARAVRLFYPVRFVYHGIKAVLRRIFSKSKAK